MRPRPTIPRTTLGSVRLRRRPPCPLTSRTGPIRTHRVWGISDVFEVPTDRGVLWFKACCDHFIAEAAIVRRLAQRIGHLVPLLVAGDDRAGWLLM